MTTQEFRSRFLRLIALTWVLPPMVGFSFLLYVEIFTPQQIIILLSTLPNHIFLLGGFLLALLYFYRYSRSLTAYLATPDNPYYADTERALRRFPRHYWGAFLGYITLAPAVAILSLENASDYIALPVDWFRVHLVALIVSIIVGLPIFISIYDLFGKAFGGMQIQRPILTIKTKVFLIGALIPLLIDTMLVQYYWTRTGFFSAETFFIWLLLELLAITGALLFVHSFSQALAPLNGLIDTPLNPLDRNIKPESLDELGIFAGQLSKLLDAQQLYQERLTFSNELLKATHNHESLAKLLQSIVDRTCQTLEGDICFLYLHDPHKNKLVCVAHSNAVYQPDGHFHIALDETSLITDVFHSKKAQFINDTSSSSRSHQLLEQRYNVRSSAAVPLLVGDQTIGVLQTARTKTIHDYNDHETGILQAFAQEAALIQALFEDQRQRRKAETAITQIMRGVSTSIGADFFNAIAVHIADILQADSCGIIAVKHENNAIGETLAFIHDGEIVENAQYVLKGSPCETVIGQQVRTYPEDLQNTFPEDLSLRELGAKSYVGIPLFDSQNKPLGLLFAMFRKPIKNAEFNESVMCIFAARTAAEIERTQIEARVQHMAYHDGLTKLPNREYLLDRLQQAIAHAQRHQTSLAIILIDLDHFKKINDSLGHPVGDGILVQVAQRLKQCVRQEDTVARLGGDEFIILQSDFDSRDSAINNMNRITKHLQSELKGHYYVAEHTLMITTSCGVAIYPDDGDTADLLIKHADTAMYKAKSHGRDNCQFFSSEMNIAAMERLEMESGIHQAMENEQFEAVYQPKVRISDNRIIGAELLLRWHHPEQGDISPERFIPIADETGQIIQLGEYVLQQACALTSELWCSKDCCIELDSLSVNVSPRQFQQPDFIDKVQQTLDYYKTHACCIELEITENILIEDIRKISAKLQAIKDIGLNISIDDFGTGYASLRYLQQLPIGMIKIDRSFIENITSSKNDYSIVKTILTMAHNLDISVIAEGVETAEQLHLLKQLGCQYYQGYYYSKPVAKDDFIAMVLQQRQAVGV